MHEKLSIDFVGVSLNNFHNQNLPHVTYDSQHLFFVFMSGLFTISNLPLPDVLCGHEIKLSSLFVSGDLVVNSQINSSSQRGHAVGISLTVILVVLGAISLGAFLLLSRHRKKKRSQMLVQ